ncbi:phenylpyruvate tautomerase MIF-related protein [Ruminococcus champanellensis]|nr:phenylpyruvate tautomerase MIF-related protein [Ruminococcus champanellensis]
MIHVEVLGAPNPSAYENMSAKLCEICAAELRIPQNRVYVCYSETANWGWNGSNF